MAAVAAHCQCHETPNFTAMGPFHGNVPGYFVLRAMTVGSTKTHTNAVKARGVAMTSPGMLIIFRERPFTLIHAHETPWAPT